MTATITSAKQSCCTHYVDGLEECCICGKRYHPDIDEWPYGPCTPTDEDNA